ncbi:ATP-dependent zinc protease family protein [Alteraurantiacibacter aquimixticola]|uniref:ATP-dependent zinc protease n=1 Tax=Alteraurantiacibacter aquimixticola TaxID=2489173 RepID=A0A4T3F1X0_9SPHN|nr:ATP-dependent zinc protease [Alteraurantiacibacter aquimixticola]TIX51166.1 ATP-dependent zinc protease [Alteraurantiacibacter aquimixticola]
MQKKPGKRSAQPVMVIGWLEYVSLPDLGLSELKAKIDTGARTSALHAQDVERFENDGEDWVRFRSVHEDGSVSNVVECPVHDVREIRNTGGVPEERIIIRTKFCIADRCWSVDVSLADRTNMTFDLIVGRTALKNHGIAVHTQKAYLAQAQQA